MNTDARLAFMSKEDSQKVSSIYKKSNVNAMVLREMANVGQVRDTTDIHRFRRRLIKAGYVATVAEILEVFAELEKAGFGRVFLGQTSGPHQSPHRFKWNPRYSTEKIGRAADTKTTQAVFAAAKEMSQPVLTSTSQEGKSVVVYQSPSGERIRLSFASRREIEELVSLLQGLL
jgi:hypothetical protein